MISIDKLLGAILIIGIFIRTLSYGRWTWKNNNKLGGVMVMFIAFIMVFLTAYRVFTKH
jgi:hypothetical protein